MTVQCGCCGAEITSTDRIDYRLNRPEQLVGVPGDRLAAPTGGLLVGPDGDTYIRCLLPVALTGGTELVFGAWMRISKVDAMYAHAVWDNDTEYANLRLSGKFANVIKPWDVLGVHAEAAVLNADELPYYTSHPLLEREWDRDEVLSRIRHPLPVPIREKFGEVWTIERTEGMRCTIDGRTVRFSSPGRSVSIDVYADLTGGSPSDFLGAVLDGYPATAEHSVEHDGEELRHAFWLSEVIDGQEEQVFHAHVVRRGTMLSVRCIHRYPADRTWAQHVLNSVRYVG
ncbi:hypothetical protein SAMN05216553_101317 [Lentzea fradiae]|uniref:DUF2199 domain-containing protein n=1 Tax=Lentzea fradiae TaxID=200378 RepID=A0A1G7KJ62_9PSEU|nr:hypothetical protein [Lentzea fradiae]SDF37237.1 hypothetical protein SAMN05216553_101317 [Lentzea fradiae]